MSKFKVGDNIVDTNTRRHKYTVLSVMEAENIYFLKILDRQALKGQPYRTQSIKTMDARYMLRNEITIGETYMSTRKTFAALHFKIIDKREDYSKKIWVVYEIYNSRNQMQSVVVHLEGALLPHFVMI